jgi:hypothetical protein
MFGIALASRQGSCAHEERAGAGARAVWTALVDLGRVKLSAYVRHFGVGSVLDAVGQVLDTKFVFS